MPQIAVQKRYSCKKRKGRFNEAMVFMIKKVFRRGVVAMALLAFSSLPAFAKETPEQIAGRKAIASLYAQTDKDVRKKDLRVFIDSMAADFKYYRREGGVLNRGQFIAQQRGGVATVENLTTVSKIQKIEWRGADAIVWVDGSSQYKQQGAWIKSTGLSRDFWSKTKKGWKIRQVVEVSKNTFINGEKVRELR